MTDPEIDEPAAAKLYDQHDMWKAIDRFTNSTRPRMWRDDGTSEHVHVPSLWDQLVDAMESGSGGEGHGEQESKPPVDTSALSLVVEIANEIRATSIEWAVARTRDNPKDLRALGSSALRQGAGHVDWLTDKVRSWNNRITLVCSSAPDRPTRLHGVPCPECGAKRVFEPQPHGEPLQSPAVVAHWNEKLLRAIECRVCARTWFRGPDLDKLAEAVMTRRELDALAESVVRDLQ